MPFLKKKKKSILTKPAIRPVFPNSVTYLKPAIWKKSESNSRLPRIQKAFNLSLKPACELLSIILNRLKLKRESVVVQEPCTDDAIYILFFFSEVVEIEPQLLKTDTQQQVLKTLPNLAEFIEHCCRKRK